MIDGFRQAVGEGHRARAADRPGARAGRERKGDVRGGAQAAAHQVSAAGFRAHRTLSDRAAQPFPRFSVRDCRGGARLGAAVSRDDLAAGPRGRGANYFSRLEMVVRPFSSYAVLDLSAKGTIRNRELFNRSHHQDLAEADPQSFTELIDLWVLEFAELYAAKS